MWNSQAILGAGSAAASQSARVIVVAHWRGSTEPGGVSMSAALGCFGSPPRTVQSNSARPGVVSRHLVPRAASRAVCNFVYELYFGAFEESLVPPRCA